MGSFLQKKFILQFFVVQAMCHIRNGKYSSSFKMNIRDIFHYRHNDLAYSPKLFLCLGVTQALSTVITRQNVSAKDRDFQNEIEEMCPATWVYSYDNFNRTHSTYSIVFGDTDTHTVELISRCELAQQEPNPCLDEKCTKICVAFCLWIKDRSP